MVEGVNFAEDAIGDLDPFAADRRIESRPIGIIEDG
jgi:hypothetical protein